MEECWNRDEDTSGRRSYGVTCGFGHFTESGLGFPSMLRFTKQYSIQLKCDIYRGPTSYLRIAPRTPRYIFPDLRKDGVEFLSFSLIFNPTPDVGMPRRWPADSTRKSELIVRFPHQAMGANTMDCNNVRHRQMVFHASLSSI